MQGSIHPDHLIAASDRKDGAFNSGDLIRCEVIDINADTEKLVCGMKGVHQAAGKTELQLGFITKEQLPKTYRLVKECILKFCIIYHSFFLLLRAMMDMEGKSYEECLQSNRTFRNPSAIEHLSKALGLNVASGVPCSFLKGLRYVRFLLCIDTIDSVIYLNNKCSIFVHTVHRFQKKTLQTNCARLRMENGL